MSSVEVVPLTSFVHGGFDAHEGRTALIDAGMAKELAEAGLVRYAAPRTTSGSEKLPTGELDAGKATAAGVEQPSSVSPAAQVSPTKTSSSSVPGVKATRRGGK